MYQNLMQGKAFNPFGCNDVPEYRSDHLDASKVKTLWSPTREASIAHNTLSWLGALPPLQKAFMPSVGQSASERLSSSPPSMFGTWPNINGYFRIDYATFIHSTGAFSVNKTNEEVLAQGAQLLNVNRGMNFFAYQSSSVYSGSKLQPESLQVLACIRFWYRLGSVKPDFVL